MKKIISIAVIILILGLLLLRDGEDSSYFENYFNNMIIAAKAKNLDSFMDNFSLQYRDDYRTNYVHIKQIVKNIFEKYDEFEAVIENVVASNYEDELGNKKSDVNMDVFAIGFKGGIPIELIGETGHLKNVTIILQKSLGSWKIIKVEGIGEFEGY